MKKTSNRNAWVLSKKNSISHLKTYYDNRWLANLRRITFMAKKRIAGHKNYYKELPLQEYAILSQQSIFHLIHTFSQERHLIEIRESKHYNRQIRYKWISCNTDDKDIILWHFTENLKQNSAIKLGIFSIYTCID